MVLMLILQLKIPTFWGMLMKQENLILGVENLLLVHFHLRTILTIEPFVTKLITQYSFVIKITVSLMLTRAILQPMM